MHSILDQRESRLNLELADQQQQLADSARRDGFSMKTLALLGAVFLPGTFLSSLFSMSFFDFGNGMRLDTFQVGIIDVQLILIPT